MRSVVDLKIELSRHDPPAMRLISRRPIEGDRLTMTGKLARTRHDVRIVVEHRGNSYRVVSVTVDAPEDGEVTSAMLGIAVKEAATDVLASAWSMFSATRDDMTARDTTERTEEYRSDFLRKQRHRTLDDPFIKRVAEVHRAAEESGAGSAIGAVKDEFLVSYKTAERWVREARKRGFLAPSRRGTGKAGD
jgi:hypothetical protein